MSSHHSANNLTNEWLTPPNIITALGGWASFDLDPCAPQVQPYPTARATYTAQDNGLRRPWFGRCWVNPPYSNPLLGQFLARLVDHGRGVALIFARTETAGFVEQVWNKADAVLFLHGRLHFHYPDGTRAAANSGAPSCLVAYGEDAVERLEKCGLPGSLVSAWRPERLTSPPERWQVRHVEFGAVVPCRDRAEAEAHVRESGSGPWGRRDSHFVRKARQR